MSAMSTPYGKQPGSLQKGMFAEAAARRPSKARAPAPRAPAAGKPEERASAPAPSSADIFDGNPAMHSTGDDAAGHEMDGTSGAEREAIVYERDGEVFADSRDVARFFGKNHKDVLRAIRNLIKSEPILGRRNFAPYKINDLTGETTSHYKMDRDGFTLLAMSFTGGQALRWKLRYIEAFNAMEARLRAQRMSDQHNVRVMKALEDPATLRKLLSSYAGKVDALRNEVATLLPQAQAFDRLSEADGSVCITDCAKTIGVPPRRLFSFMRGKDWIYSRRATGSDVAYQDRIRQGYLEHKVTVVPQEDGSEKVFTQVRVTPKGMARLALLATAIMAGGHREAKRLKRLEQGRERSEDGEGPA